MHNIVWCKCMTYCPLKICFEIYRYRDGMRSYCKPTCTRKLVIETFILLHKAKRYHWQAYRHTGVQAYRRTGVQAYRHTGIQAYRHMHPYTRHYDEHISVFYIHVHGYIILYTKPLVIILSIHATKQCFSER